MIAYGYDGYCFACEKHILPGDQVRVHHTGYWLHRYCGDGQEP